MSEIRDLTLAEAGERKIAWARRNMPLLNSIEKEFAAVQPFKGLKITLSVHMEAKTANLCRTLAGAWCGDARHRLQSALHTGRRGRCAFSRERPTRHPVWM